MPNTPELHCPICDEPLDSYELREIAESTNTSYLRVRAEFLTRGCKVLEPICGPQPHCEPAQPIARDALAPGEVHF
jgi:hypothetical protein